MTDSSAEQASFEKLEQRIRTILPDEYEDHYEEVEPVSMGSASLKYGVDGRVSWNEIWDTFCDLAMAGGPPHKGSLLEPGSQAEITAAPDKYRDAVAEICRGIVMTTELEAKPSDFPGWVRVECPGEGTAEWLLRAIVMENISAWHESGALFLPAGPNYRVTKEIKNVITAITKTSHYWMDHVWSGDQHTIAQLFAEMEAESPLITPVRATEDFPKERYEAVSQAMAKAICQLPDFKASKLKYLGWLGIECPDVRSAVWMMRTMVASNVLTRRENTAFFVPVNPGSDPEGTTVSRFVEQTYRFAIARHVL